MFGSRSFRRKLFVSRRIQGRLLFRLGMYWIVYHAVLCFGLFAYRYIQHRILGPVGGTAVSLSELYRQFIMDNVPLLVCAVAMLPVVILEALKVTHGIAGPLVRFRRTFRRLVEGQTVDCVTLRKGDLLAELQEDFNTYLEFLADQQRRSSSVSDRVADRQDEQVVHELTELRSTLNSAIQTEQRTSGSVAAAIQ